MLHAVICSGGMDSFTLLHHVRHQIEKEPSASIRASEKILAISFDYGQRHRKELEYAKAECAFLNIPHEIIRLESAIRRGNSSLTFGAIPVPHGHYADETMKQTVVPGRNTIMLSVAMGWAESMLNTSGDDQAQVYYGAHSGDHAIYPDCRPEFFFSMQKVYDEATEGRVRLRAPFLYDNKTIILQRGWAAGLKPQDYARTWTCYEGGEHPCGKCGSCQERLEAFGALGLQDPGFAGKNKS